MEGVKEIFREHLKECFAHFSKLYSAAYPRFAKGRIDALNPLANFCKADLRTVSRWFERDHLPLGVILIRLMCYLDLHGYKVIEFERMPRVVKNFAELLGYSVVAEDNALSLIGFVDLSSLCKVVWGKRTLTKEKEEIMWNIWKENRENLESRKKDAFENFRLNVFPATPAFVQLRPAELPVKTNGTGINPSAILNILEGAVALVDQFPEKNLLDFASQILRLSAHLNELSVKIIYQRK